MFKKLLKKFIYITQDSINILSFYRLRSILMLLSMMIAIGMIVSVYIVSDSGKLIITKELEKFGIKTFWVYINHRDHFKQCRLPFPECPHLINNQDQAQLKAIFPEADFIPKFYGNAKIIVNNLELNYAIQGTTPAAGKYIDIQDGRFITDFDIKNTKKVCVLSNRAAQYIFKGNTPIGKELQFLGHNFIVIGVLSDKEKSFLENFGVETEDLTDRIFVPLSTLQGIYNTDKFKTLEVRANTLNHLILSKKVLALLQASHNNQVQYEKELVEKYSETASSILHTINVVLGTISIICLFVCCLGITNMMLVSVNERRKEIGIRMAIGAKRYEIILQFLMEAVCIGFIGGLGGIIISYVGWFSVKLYFGIVEAFSVSTLFWTILISILAAILAGLYPAIRASRMVIADSIKYE